MTLKRIITQGINPGYITNATYLQSLYGADAGTTTNFFNTPISFVISNDPTTSGMSWSSFTTTPMLKYTSYSQFVSDLSRNAITYPFSWLMYDNENWAQTPQNEMDHPWTYMTSFVTLAHAHGYRVMLAPARDLGNDVTSINPRLRGETLDAWYLRTYVAAWAAYAGADIVEIQAQVDTLTGGFVSFFNSALAQIRAYSTCPVWVGVSTTYGTAAQMAAAAQSVSADGYWLNASSATLAQADSFLRLMPAPNGISLSGLARVLAARRECSSTVPQGGTCARLQGHEPLYGAGLRQGDRDRMAQRGPLGRVDLARRGEQFQRSCGYR